MRIVHALAIGIVLLSVAAPAQQPAAQTQPTAPPPEIVIIRHGEKDGPPDYNLTEHGAMWAFWLGIRLRDAQIQHIVYSDDTPVEKSNANRLLQTAQIMRAAMLHVSNGHDLQEPLLIPSPRLPVGRHPITRVKDIELADSDFASHSERVVIILHNEDVKGIAADLTAELHATVADKDQALIERINTGAYDYVCTFRQDPATSAWTLTVARLTVSIPELKLGK